MPRAIPVEIFDLTIVVDLTIGVDLTIDYDVISDLTDDSWKSGDWCWLTKDDDEISYLTNDDDETNESRGKKQTK